MDKNRFVSINPNDPDESALEMAVGLLRNGKIVVYPTDTTYALGANALDITAIKRIFDLKKRAEEKPIHVVVSDLKMAERFVIISEVAERLAKIFLPGPLTLILPRKENVPDILVGGRKTLGIRIPDNKICLMLAQKANIPFTATSANISGAENLYSTSELHMQFSSNLHQIDLVIDQGPLLHKPPSTLVDLTTSPPQILREGPISGKLIFEAIR